ncbi:MAG TPA: hypothetical protein EYP04_05375, partial [Anaerolineae bacterium]|nr:hypothetical protein [Anaerolineae bacterium]
MLRENPGRAAWIILVVAFTLFCLLAITIPLSIRGFLLYSRQKRPARLALIEGTALLLPKENTDAIAVVDVRQVRPGMRIKTDENSRATLTFSVDEAGEVVLMTVQIYGNVDLELVKCDVPRFQMSPEPHRVHLFVRAGRVRVTTTNLGRRALEAVVITPHGSAHLGNGSYSVEVDADSSQFAVRYGVADVISQGKAVAISSDQRIEIRAGQPPGAPLSAAENLLMNGDFRLPLEEGWIQDTYQQSPDATPGTVEIVEAAGRRAAFFSRIGKEPVHTEVGITQVVDKDVRDFVYLSLRMDVRLLHQSLGGGGYLSSEFPLMVQINYTDVYGKQLDWYHGFYYRDPDPDLNWPIVNGEKILAYVWYPYES